MKQKQILLLAMAFLSVGVLFISCSKQGPVGPTGATGAQGPVGPAGPKGDTGTANVLYSAWFTPPSYTKDTVYGIYGFNYNKPVSALTQNILDNGTILVFGKLDGYVTSIWPAGQIAQMPITITYLLGSTIYYDTWSALATLGNIRIRFVDDKNFYGSISNSHQFRYIIIPGGVSSNSLPPDYKTLCEKFHIPEN